MKKILIAIVGLIAIQTALGQKTVIQNVYNRTSTSLNGDWRYIVDPYENGYYNYRYEAFDKQTNTSKSAFFMNSKPEGPEELLEYDFDKMEHMSIPGDWNSQKKELYYYEGTIWYKRSFDYAKSKNNNRVFVHFGAVNYQADVYLNGHKLGVHRGGFTPFNFEVTELLKEQNNFLVLKVDNKRKKEAVPTLNTDWWNYGGITREVRLIETPATYINDYFIHLDSKDATKIKVNLVLNGNSASNKKISVRIPELNLDNQFVSNDEGVINTEFRIEKIKYWSLKNPKLYQVFISSEDEQLEDQIGFRTVKTQGKEILLNGEAIFLKGISIHEESPIRGGRAHTLEDAKKLLGWAKELGCNFVRLAHYPHNEHMVRLADQMGMLVWEENPVYWTIDWNNSDTYNNAHNQLNELIDRDKNRASVIIWSMANETPTSSARNLFLSKLTDFARKKDPTRLISAALEQSSLKNKPGVRTISDPFANKVDILSFNQYIGWYDGAIEKCKSIAWEITQDKPVIISEFGAGAKQGNFGDKNHRWTEEYQEYLYEETLKMISKIDQLRGVSPWILVDFKSPRRVLPGIQDGWNRKGLISETGVKKKAFYILQNFYSTK